MRKRVAIVDDIAGRGENKERGMDQRGGGTGGADVELEGGWGAERKLQRTGDPQERKRTDRHMQTYIHTQSHIHTLTHIHIHLYAFCQRCCASSA